MTLRVEVSLPHLLSVARANLLTSGSLQPGLISLSGQPLTLLGPTFPMPSPGPTAGEGSEDIVVFTQPFGSVEGVNRVSAVLLFA